MAKFTKKEDIAWAAGFFEGEGCFYAHYYPPRKDGSRIFRMSATLCQKDKSLLEKFQRIVKCGKIDNGTDKGVYKWFSGKKNDGEKVFLLLKNHLSERRIKTAENLIKKEKQQILRPQKECCSKGHKYDKMRTGRNGKKHRLCSICNNEYAKQWRAKQPLGYWKKTEMYINGFTRITRSRTIGR